MKINGNYSKSRLVKCGVPQGSALGPKLFNMHVNSQSKVFKTSFADDLYGMRTFSISFQYNILRCIDNIVCLMNAHFLKIYPDKTELNLLYPKSLQKEVIIGGTIIECVSFSDVKNVRVIYKHFNSIVLHH